jgi:transposase
MRKTREILRLHFLGLKQRQIARSCSIAQSTVNACLQAAKAAVVTWPEVADWDYLKLETALFGERSSAVARRQKPAPDFAVIEKELQSHEHLTLQLVWEEYRQGHPESYAYSRFCDLYREWSQRHEVVLRQEHVAGEKLWVDYAGDTVPIHESGTGEVHQASIFVAVLACSSYTYAEATWSQELNNWIGSHVRAFEHFRGLPAIVVPDNLRSGVTRANRYEPDLNKTYQEMAEHYGVAIIPTRPYKARDKAKVESGVLLVERWILAALRKHKFFHLSSLNQAIAELLERLNNRPFRKREGTRASLLESVDRPALRPLPVERFEFGSWKTARVNIDYHVEIDHHYYSVPYALTGQRVEVRSTGTTVEIFQNGLRVVSHARSEAPYQATTVEQHRPKSHQRYLEWTPSRILEWAQTIGPATAKLFQEILATRRHPEQGYRSCLGIVRLGKKYSRERVEAAARRAGMQGACSYKSIKSILERQLDRVPIEESSSGAAITHDNIRGAAYFDPSKPPTIQ